jgi:hypothetical protein
MHKNPNKTKQNKSTKEENLPSPLANHVLIKLWTFSSSRKFCAPTVIMLENFREGNLVQFSFISTCSDLLQDFNFPQNMLSLNLSSQKHPQVFIQFFCIKPYSESITLLLPVLESFVLIVALQQK